MRKKCHKFQFCRNLLSHFFGKNFVKLTSLLKKLISRFFCGAKVYNTRVHSSVPWHFEKMFTATLLALGTRLVKFHFSTLVKISVFASFALKIEQLSIKWAQGCLKLKIWVLIRLKHAWKPKLEIWNFTSLVPRARSVAVNIFSKCHGKDEWTLERLWCTFEVRVHKLSDSVGTKKYIHYW